ncbi:uncharacterized protein LOC128557961 [Mercenaria mercenaria]|uniref:uncharacterized protein LOC128557961 n=1 Tax=Mercenaria mercenaria TaxID=6596 RepID=UPI00234F96A3|nr:uncharacterized protein LOC128557961 [Mercenaria mercenaria]XP_053402624.1 uncharacterized protein LOC128557961 [Mercenaria mercenaria]XP_053402625.1 uncharacterized protein LOC128557961 [Mercenaria mercenaria]
MSEKTRIWGTDRMCDMEFDYLAIMKPWPGCGNFKFNHTTPGEMDVEYEVIDPQSVAGEYDHLSLDVKHVFLANFYKCMHEKCMENFCASVTNRNIRNISNGCQFCSVYMQAGNLTCTDTMLWPYMQQSSNFGRLKFLWRSKINSINIPYTFKDMDDLLIKGYNRIACKSETANRDSSPLSLKWRKEKVNKITIEVDFNPVLMVDVTRVQNKAKPVSKLDKDKNYFLFPKSREVGVNSWRISTWEIELDILTGSSTEHRLAYTVLKFMSKKNLGIFEISHNQYELKLDVIRHIQNCKTPNIGAHVCLLYILHDIAICKCECKRMHPLLHFNLYDVFRSNKYDYILHIIYLKVFILLLANQKGLYSVSEVLHDLFSIKSVEETFSSGSASYCTLCPSVLLGEKFTRQKKLELQRLIRIRKKNNSENVLLTVIKAMQRIERKRKLQILIQEMNLRNVQSDDKTEEESARYIT